MQFFGGSICKVCGVKKLAMGRKVKEGYVCMDCVKACAEYINEKNAKKEIYTAKDLKDFLGKE